MSEQTREAQTDALGSGEVTGSSGARRALFFGVQTYLDEALPARPGTSAALRHLAELFELDGWEVHLLIDDAAEERARPLAANLLAQLDWLAGGAARLALISCGRSGAYLLPRDARAHLLELTALDMEALAPRLRGCGVLLDVPSEPGCLEGADWILGAPAGEEQLSGQVGPTRFLRRALRGLSGQAGDGTEAPISNAALARFVMTETGRSLGNPSEGAPTPPWFTGEPRALLRPQLQGATCGRCGELVEDALATFCPACGQSLFGVERLDGGRYRLLRALGEGGMGKVFLAEDTRLKAERAIKLLSLPAGLPRKERDDLRGRLLQEAQAAQRLSGLSHHVVQVFDLGHSSEHGEPFLVMEVLDGETLTEHLKRGPLGLDATVQIGREIAETLAVAHGEGMIHRDLKPENIMLIRRAGRANFVKLLDFGLVKMEEAEVKTATGHIMGTLQYMPPEQLKGERVDARADIFSFAAILYECLAGQRAVPGRTQREIFAVLLGGGVRPLAEVAPEAPRVLTDLIDRALSLDIEARPEGVAEFLAIFDALMSPRSSALVTQALDKKALERRASGPRRALLPLLFAVGLGCGWGGARLLSTPTSMSGAVRTLVDAAPEPAAVVDAAAPAVVDAAVDAAPKAPPWTPPPLEALPSVEGVTRKLEGDRLVYSGGDPSKRFAAVVVDALLAAKPLGQVDEKAEAAWAEAPEAARARLAERLEVQEIEGSVGDLKVSALALESARATSHHTQHRGRLWTFWFKKDKPLIIVDWRKRCRKPKPKGGDLLVTASWSIRGYDPGRCEDSSCAGKMDRALLEAKSAGELSHLNLKISRKVKESEETRFNTRCRL